MFIKTENYDKIIAALDAQRDLIGNLRPIVIVNGGFGTGKTQCLLYISAQYVYPLIRAEVRMSQSQLLHSICLECNISLKKDATIKELKRAVLMYFREHANDKVLLVDEADFILNDTLLETLRWLTDESKAGLLVAGMAGFRKELATQYPHFVDRSPGEACKVQLKKLTRDNVADIISNHYDIPFTESAIDYVHTVGKGGYRLTFYLLKEAVKAARNGQLEKITEAVMEAIE